MRGLMRRGTLLVAAAGMCLGWALFASAQDKGGIVVEPANTEPPPKNAGVFIGINDFKDRRLDQLDYAVNDAVAMAYLAVVELKLIPPANCHLLVAGEPTANRQEHLARLKSLGVRLASATNDDIIGALDELAETGGDLLLMSISSHGVFDSGIAYVVPSSGNVNRLGDTAVRMTSIEEMLVESKARNRLLLIDACQQRLSVKATGKPPESRMSREFEQALRESTGQIKVASCKPGEFGHEDRTAEQGAFTSAFLRALRGEAIPPGARPDRRP